MGNCNNKKRKPFWKYREASDIGFVLLIIGIVTVCAFILPPRAWIMLLGVILVIFGIWLLRC